MLGLLEFARVASGSSITNTAVDDKDSSDDTDDAGGPLNKIGDHLAGVDAFASGAVADVATGADKSNTNGPHDDTGRHGDGEADESLGEGFLGGGDFAGVAARENIEVATVNNITDDKVRGDDGDVSDDIGDNEPDARLEGFFVADVFRDAAVPRGETQEASVATAKTATIGKRRGCGDHGRHGGNHRTENEKFFE